ncbi:MAG TPA: phasin family protein [Thermoanaerobaculia bacterium]|nr:phasin family protein [Thermoanaerobaculia bacterium]
MSQAEINTGMPGKGLLAAGRSLWLAGLGAVAKTADADRESRVLFDRLVEKGRPVEERGRETVEGWSERTGETFRELGQLVRDTVEYESKGLLKRFGIATRDDFKVLSNRLDILARNVDEMVARWQVERAEAMSPAAPAEIILTTATGTPIAKEA